MAPAFIIQAALKGGYIVRQDSGRDFIPAVHYAGTLEDCLAFVRTELLAAANPTADAPAYALAS